MAAERGFERLRAAAKAPVTRGSIQATDSDIEKEATEASRIFQECMDNDFDTPGAIAALFDLARAINRARDANAPLASVTAAVDVLSELTSVLGLDLATPAAVSTGDAAPFIDLLVTVREQLRSAKQWAIARYDPRRPGRGRNNNCGRSDRFDLAESLIFGRNDLVATLEEEIFSMVETVSLKDFGVVGQRFAFSLQRV